MAAAENQVNQENHVEMEGGATAHTTKTSTNVGNTNNTNSMLTTKLLEQHRDTLKTLRSNISELANNTSSGGGADDDVSDQASPAELLLSSALALSNLKSLQRQISLQVEAHANVSKDRREKVEECSLVLENLNYEQDYLIQSIGSMQGWKTGELEKMAWSELGIDPTKLMEEGGEEGKKEGGANGGSSDDADMADANKSKITTAEEAIDAYLLGDNDASIPTSHRDPSNHPYILQKLQSDLQARSSLVEQLSKSKLELKELQKKRNDLRGFLNQIPKKLLELEKAGESLNTFFGSSNVWEDVLNENDDENGGDETMDGTSNTEKTMEEKVQAANLLIHRPSCDRTKRFQLAQSNLPSPLYVLFVQLVGYMDAWASLEKLGGTSSSVSAASSSAAAAAGEKKSNVLDGFVGANGMDVSVVSPEGSSDGNNSWSVVLTLSPSDNLPSEITSILGKAYSTHSRSASPSIKIVFIYSKEQGLVFASVNDEENNDGLLDNLFPGDDGLANPNVSMSLLKQEEDEENDDDSDGEEDHNVQDKSHGSTKNGTNGKPYYWCQVLSGLNFPPPSSSTNIYNEGTANNDRKDSPFQTQTCTKAVFRQLHRRIRARKTLAAVLEFLGKRSQLHPLPIHPAMRGEDGANQPQPLKAKLHSWAEDSKEGNHKLAAASTFTKRYIATIKRKSSTLKATVVIDTQNYPADPPVWSLQNEDGSSGTQSSWGEDHGSVSSLRQESNNNSTNAPPLFDAALHRIECHVKELDKFVRQDVETTYDWILIHQLADIVSCWDEAMSAGEGSSSSTRAKSGDGRLRKGKDRQLMGFGERSPFFW
eukprot:CAMPEP_0172317302 /NCGR_PEP_ID=MMETSP1058-20130122/31203_1 /TAXON_ID=83371 /ORGANISM="Detonula confervacea, Strain CCMP 353" /LENGTH=822 /DNA_ID=CAMNT_0013031827 /DNA_START=149 /DNA_END=2614 /DNA_ORIENTATION=+